MLRTTSLIPWLLLSCLAAQSGEDVEAKQREAEAIKEAVRQFQATWPRGSTTEKALAVRTLARHEGTEVAMALASKLPDGSGLVRKEIADALVKQKEPKTIPALAAALQREFATDEGSIDTLRSVCQALGSTNDPRAIAPLVNNLFSGNRQDDGWNDQVQARLDGLGLIRHKDAVDELVGLFGRTGNAGRGGGRRLGGGNNASNQRIQQGIRRNLRKLTGQDLSSQDEWRKWWRDNKESFRFEGK
jgi:HEAT repeat protein